MKLLHPDTPQKQETPPPTKPEYEAPAVIYEGFITTRAGTPVSLTGNDTGVDPTDLFGDH